MTLEGQSPAGRRRKFHPGSVQPAVSFVELANAAPAGGLTDLKLSVHALRHDRADRVLGAIE